MKQKVFRVGNSVGVTIPSDFVKAIGIKSGDTVEVEKIMEKNQLIYKFSGVQQLLIAANFWKKEAKKK
ncbi:AbrB/MazE/SpoVT family DNA-binding domain-containing protein [Patescibacteria group bacterium]